MEENKERVCEKLEQKKECMKEKGLECAEIKEHQVFI